MAILSCSDTVNRLDRITAAVPSAQRAQECARILRDATVALHAGGQLEGVARVQEFAVAFQDASMIVDAFDVLANSDVVGARDHLREALLGNTVVVSGTGNDEPRNHLWTTFLGACFQKQGLTPRFVDAAPPEHGVKSADLVVSVEGTMIAVEAKRIRSASRLGRHVSKAVQQIAASCESGDAVAGCIAIDVSFALDHHAQTEIWQLNSRNSLSEVREQIRPELAQMLRTVADAVEKQPGARHVVGATVLVLPVVRYADARQLGLIRYFASTLFDAQRSRDGSAAFTTLRRRCFSDQGA